MPRPARQPDDTVPMGKQIKRAAHAQMAQNGTAGISLRGIARELGITAPAIYNYYPRLDDLITALIVDAFNALADAIQTAEETVAAGSYGDRILASCLAYREWAIAHPVDFQLIYGNPIPGYAAPAEITVPLARRSFDGLFRLFLEAYEIGVLSIPPEYAPVPAGVSAHVATWLPEAGYAFPDALLCLLMSGWARIHGMVMLELFGHIGPVVGDTAAFYQYELEAFMQRLGLETANGTQKHADTRR